MLELLEKNKEVFATKTSQLTATHILEHHIRLTDDRPFCQRPPRSSQVEKDAADEVLNYLINHDYIEPSISPYSSRYLIVPKKDGGYRMCIDYRLLNSRTEKDAYSLPGMEEILDQLAGSEVFSVCDMVNGFLSGLFAQRIETVHSILLSSRTCTSGDDYQWVWLDHQEFFKEFWTSHFREIKPKSVANYLDDLIIFGKDWDTHLNNLQKVFDKLKEANLKLSITKCFFGVEQIVFLGISVSKEGFKPDKRKVEAVEKMIPPKTVRQCREFLGLAGFFRKFIQDFSVIAAPLHQLTKKEAKFDWTDGCQKSFDTLKTKLINAPLLHHFDPTKKIILVTDASDIGIGAVLQLEIDDCEVPVGYWSRLLTKSERNYCVSDREVLAVVWAVKKCRHFLMGQKFTLITDHSALVHLMNTLDAQGRWARWIVLLLGYTFEIKHRKGSLNAAADALSRQPLNVYDQVSVENDVDDLILVTEQVDMQSLQLEDNYCRTIINKLGNQMDADRNGFSLIDGILIKTVTTEDGEKELIVLPEKMLPEVLKACHDHPLSGHGGYLRTLVKVRQRFYRRKLPKIVRRYVKSCTFCLGRKPRNNFPEGIPSSLPSTSVPFQIQSIDFAGPINESLAGNKYILLTIDMATRYVISRATADQSSATVINFIEEELIKRVGKPDVLISDHGSCFNSQEFELFLAKWNIKHQMSSPYHPQSNGMVESANKTYGIMLTSIYQQFPSIWDQKTRDIDFAMNTSISKGTGRSPYSLVYLKEPPLVVDSIINKLTNLDITRDPEEATLVRMTAADRSKEQQEATETYREKHLVSRQYKEGEEVLVWKPNPEPNLSKKLTSNWVGPIKIKRKMPNLPATYELQANELTRRWKSLTVNVMNLRKFHPRDRNLQSDPNTDNITIRIVQEEPLMDEEDENDHSSDTPEEPVSEELVVPLPQPDRNEASLPEIVTERENQAAIISHGSHSALEDEVLTPLTEEEEPVLHHDTEEESCPEEEEENEPDDEPVERVQQPHSVTWSGRQVFKPNTNFYYN